MKSPIEDTIWGASYGSLAAVQAAFDRIAPVYHEAILASGAPAGAARAMLPLLAAEAQGIDFGCGSGVLGLELRALGFAGSIDGVDLSPVMLNLAQETGSYRRLVKANLLEPESYQLLPGPYDFAISMGLIGDYVPYYLALPRILAALRPGAHLGFAVESRSTPWRALEKLMGELRLEILSETVLTVPEGELTGQAYHFYVAQLSKAGGSFRACEPLSAYHPVAE